MSSNEFNEDAVQWEGETNTFLSQAEKRAKVQAINESITAARRDFANGRGIAAEAVFNKLETKLAKLG